MSFKKCFLPFLTILILLSSFDMHLHLHIDKHDDHHHVSYDVSHDEIDSYLLHTDIETDLTVVGRLFLLLSLLMLIVGFSLLTQFRYKKTLFAPFVYHPYPYQFNKNKTFLKSLLFHAPPVK